MRRKAGALAALFTLAGATLAVLASPAGAQTGYPPPACTANASTQSLGSFDVGDTFTVTLAPSCVFQPGAAVAVTVNGVSVGTKFANSSGFVTVTITVVSTTTLSVDDPVLVPVVCGQNSVTATGFSAVANGTVSQTAVFTVNCGPAAGGGPTNNNNTNNNLNNNQNTVNVGGDTITINVPGGGGPGPGGGGGQTQTQTQNQTQSQSQFERVVGHGPIHTPGRIAFTGANIIGLSLLALTAMLMGVFLLSSVKRRREGARLADEVRDEPVEPELTLS